MYAIALRISLQSPSAVYCTDIYPPAARPAHTWMFQQGDVPLQHVHCTRVQELQEFTFLILSYYQ